ncbi:Fic family protein [Candidatus Gracilibacteria bacterium]|nr:Fic family protein [Candidatus Gracilibacteria bacterium]
MKNFIAGKYIQQTEYKSFSPTLINELAINWKSDKTLELWGNAKRYLGELNAYSSLIPDVDFFIEMHIIKEATTSSRIEGTKTEIDEAIQPESRIAPEKKDDWQEVRNYIEAMNDSIKNLDKLPLSMRLIKQAHQKLLFGVRGYGKTPGEIRKSQNWIGGGSLKTAKFIPPSSDNLPDLLSDLEKFWHRQDIPELIRIAIAHYQFETIHPFLDGNGRTGRLIITLHLVDLGILSKPTLYLSDFFERKREEYFDALEDARKKNDLESWVQFFLDGVIQTAKKGKRTFDNIIELRKEYDEKILTLGKRAKLAQRLLTKLYSNPVISPREAESFLGITPTPANTLLKAMEEIRMLKEISGQERNRIYILNDYIQLFKN